MSALLVRLREGGISYWRQAIVSGLFTGLAPIASGTVASAVACLFYFIPGFPVFWVALAAAAVAFAVGVALSGRVEDVLGPDPSFVTIDEFAGQWLTLASPAALFGAIQPTGIWWVVLCFLVFRTFDIAKIWPASALERAHGGWGIMSDDIAAAVYANVASHLIWIGLSWLQPVLGFLK